MKRGENDDMKLFYYFIDSLFSLAYILSLDYFYYTIFKKSNMKQNHFFLPTLIFQVLICLIFPYIKEKSVIISSIMFYIGFYLGLVCYYATMENKIIYYISSIAIGSCSDIIGTSLTLIILNVIHKNQITFLDYLMSQPMYFAMNIMIVSMIAICVVKYICYMIKMIPLNQLNRFFSICLLPLTLLLATTNTLYSAFFTGNNFISATIIFFIAMIIALTIICIGIDKYYKVQTDNKKIKENKSVLKMQIEEMKSIDLYYQEIRRKTHDFQNHCIVTLTIFNEGKDDVKDYIQSMIESYQGGQES